MFLRLCLRLCLKCFLILMIFVGAAFADFANFADFNLGPNLTERLNQLKQTDDVSLFKDQSLGEWIQVADIQAHYYYYSASASASRGDHEKLPLRVHFEGLAGSIDQALDENFVLQKHISLGGPVLVVEFIGQGDREVLRQYEKKMSAEKVISHQKNINTMLEILQAICQRHDLSLDDVIWSGHSFGGMFMADLVHKFSSRLLQFFSTGVTHYHNVLLSEQERDYLNYLKDLQNNMNPFLRLGDQVALNSAKNFLLGLTPSLEADPVALKANAGLIVGSGEVNAQRAIENLEVPQQQIQIFTGEEDRFVFSMLHYDLVLAAQESGHKVSAIIVEEASHFITKTMTQEQVKQVLNLSQRPFEYSGFYFLTIEGELISLTSDEALSRYKELSWEAWLKYGDIYRYTFAFAGVTAEYPSAWVD